MLSIENNRNQTDEEIQDIPRQTESMTSATELAHEIRNPLTAVKGFIQLLKPHLIEIGKEQYADLAIEEINRANDLLFDFLNTSKSQNTKTEVPLNKLLENMAMLYQMNKIQIDVSLSIRNPTVLANERQLKQVLANVIKNAIEAAPQDVGRITLSSDYNDSSAFIIIEDNGTGMTKQEMQNLFTPFYSSKDTGTGIGLPICKKIIEEHGGSVQISSLEGKGTMFKIELPIYKRKTDCSDYIE
ncbi:GHKL domain-containing protein [Cytobacillus depressus]|uniref:histidine kinase n=1 Tax=Cytobacillus depressus TaxID=1602942 RepID=A0A6L3V3M8_9BACI|nr:ATP-binding protein [Cytobacillus depressus]KAB2331536.1 GHKL domain-containing protein [Cytobacillus depressus]